MGIEDRDWHRETDKKLHSRVELPVGVLVLAAIVGGLILAAALRSKTEPQAARGGTQYTHNGPSRISILPGLPAISIGGDALYAKSDPWRAYLADEKTCPGGERLDAPLPEQAATMVCLVNYARQKRGLQPVTTVTLLNQTSIAKAEKIVRCLDFNHDACGQDAAADVRATGYRGAWGENLFIAEGPYGAPRPALDGWLNSPGHRENLFRPEWRTQGIAVQKIAKFGSDRNVTLWINQFATW